MHIRKKQEESEQLLREFFKNDITINAEKQSFSNLWDEFKVSEVKTKTTEVQKEILKIELALQEAFIVHEIYKKELKNKIDESSFLNKIFYLNTSMMERDLYPCTKVKVATSIDNTYVGDKYPINVLRAVLKDMKHISQNLDQDFNCHFTITIEPPKPSWIDRLCNFFDKIFCYSSQIDSCKYTVSIYTTGSIEIKIIEIKDVTGDSQNS